MALSKRHAFMPSTRRSIDMRLALLDSVLGRVRTLPTGWGHKTEVQAGDVVYLRHNDTIRSMLLVNSAVHDISNGKVPTQSPIGQTLLGRHVGEAVRLVTLDGSEQYEIVKII